MNGLDLFSGIGGISFALRKYVRPCCYCENDPFCQGVLLSRMHTGELSRARIRDDIKTFPTICFTAETVDIIYGGFPCQDISCAGNGKGLEGERSGLFFEMLRLAKEIKPKFVFLENVPAISTRGGLRVVKEIADSGYDCRWCTISAASVGALHNRKRWFLLAKLCNTNGKPSRQTDTETEPDTPECDSWRRFTGQYWPFESREHWQKTVSEMGKCADGISHQVDRLRSLGNAVVPQQAQEAFQILMGIN
jgi:DNA (cytosine-5)-methyltransferase 1